MHCNKVKGSQCDLKQRTWCNGYTCVDGVLHDELRQQGEPCKSSSECSTSVCEKPQCDAMMRLGISREKCEQMGVCVLK